MTRATSLVVEASPDGAAWSPLTTVPLQGLYPYFVDAALPPQELRHLRVRASGGKISDLGQVSIF